MLNQITPIILTFNEQANIRRTLAALNWAADVIVIDSGSTDETLQICAEYSNVRCIHRTFDNFANQCNFALTQAINTEWVLSMDADYVVTAELVAELNQLTPSLDINGYQIEFQYLINGKALRGSLYPPRTALYRKKEAHYQQDGHAHKVNVNGGIAKLSAKIQHDDRKTNQRWLKSQWIYAQQEAKKLKQSRWADLATADKLRRLGLAPLIILPYTLLVKGLLLNGVSGLAYSFQRFIAEVYLLFALFKKAQ